MLWLGKNNVDITAGQLYTTVVIKIQGSILDLFTAENMADEIPVIPKASEIVVHTGNTVNWARLKKKITQTPDEELSECVSSAIGEWKSKQDPNELQGLASLLCTNERFMEKLPEEEREELKVTLKIFCPTLAKGCVSQAVDRVLGDLGTTYVETVLLSVPQGHLGLEDMKELWEELEELVSEEKVLSLGVAEFNKVQLEELFNWAKVKPCIVQINLDVCCVVPPELQEYAKQNDIQLLTHNDPQDILPVPKFQEMISTNFTSRDGENWQPSWCCRYSVLVKCRGIIKSKGYVVKGERDLKKRK